MGAAVEAHPPSHPDEASWDKPRLEKLPKAELIDIILDLQVDLHRRLQEKDRRIAELTKQLAQRQGEIDQAKEAQKRKDINRCINQPTSKKPEWDKDGNPKPTKKGRKKKRQKRTGCGNLGKSDLTPDETNFIPLTS